MTLRAPFIALSVSLLILQGCSQQPLQQAETPLPAPEPEPAEEVIESLKPIPAETLYALLVAEIAGARERYDIALGNYMQQAHRTRDKAITARATRIARYLNVRQAALNSSLLWVELAPEDSEARFIAASELVQADRLGEALEHSVALLENRSTPLFETIAARAAKLTDTQRAPLRQRFEALHQQYPDNADIVVSLGLLQQQQGDLEQALQLARQAQAIKTDHISAAILEAILLTELEQPEQGLQRLHEALQQTPDNKRLRLQYARLLTDSDLAKAQEQFQILADQTPRDTDLLFSLALVSRERGMLAEAEQRFSQLLASDKHRSAAHYYLGRIMEEKGDDDAALMHYLQVSPGPDFLPSLLQSTDLLVRTDRAQTARERLNEARRVYPKQAERLYLLEAEVLSKHLKLEQASHLLSEGLQQTPNSIQMLYSRAMINEQLDQLGQLEQDLRTILKYDPNNATALNALGYTLADRTQRFDEALTLINQALQISPDDPAIIDSMGWVQYRLGNFEEALLRLRQAMRVLPDHEIAAHLGEVLWVSGAQEEARTVWRQGLQLKPDSRIIRDTLQRLAPDLSLTPETGAQSITR